MKDRQALKLKIKKQLVWYSFIIVSIITLIVLTYIPMLTTIKYSFHDIQVLGFGEDKFIGFQNYEKIMNNSSFVKSIGNTFLLALCLPVMKLRLAGCRIPIIPGLGQRY